MQKRILLSTVSSLLVAGTLFTSTAYAQTVTGTVGTTVPTTTDTTVTASPAPGSMAAQRALMRAQRQQKMMTTRMSNADQEIERRLTALGKQEGNVNGMQRVSSDEKSSLTAEIQTNITDLTNLKAKIDADTDMATLKTDKQSIVNSYRIFALLMPKIEIMAHADAMITLANQMSTNTTNFQNRIQQSGKDISSITPLLTDRSAKIADAITQAQNAINAVTPLTPDGYPANKATLLSARTMLQTGRKDLQAAYQDMVKANQAFKALTK